MLRHCDCRHDWAVDSVLTGPAALNYAIVSMCFRVWQSTEPVWGLM